MSLKYLMTQDSQAAESNMRKHRPTYRNHWQISADPWYCPNRFNGVLNIVKLFFFFVLCIFLFLNPVSAGAVTETPLEPIPSKDRGTFLIVVNSDLQQQPGIQASLDRYKNDLAAQGFQKVIQKNWVYTPFDDRSNKSHPDAPALKSYLKKVYDHDPSVIDPNAPPLEGCLFVGKLPYVLQEVTKGDTGDKEDEWTSGLYFMDLGLWQDTDGDGAYETIEGGTTTIDFYVGILDLSRVPGVDLNGDGFKENETQLVNQYFEKNHNYRMGHHGPKGEHSLARKAMIVDVLTYAGADKDIVNAYPEYSILDLKSPITPTTAQMIPYFTEGNGYEWFQINAHGNYWGFSLFHDGTSDAFKNFELSELNDSFKNDFVSFNNCAIGRYNSVGYFIGVYLARKEYGLAADWGLQTGESYNQDKYYYQTLGTELIGEAFKNSWNRMIAYDKPSAHSLFSSIFGDPTLWLFQTNPVQFLPNMTVKSFSIDDTSNDDGLHGNGNRILEPGEVVKVIVKLDNAGGDAHDIAGTLMIDNDEVSVIRASAQFTHQNDPGPSRINRFEEGDNAADPFIIGANANWTTTLYFKLTLQAKTDDVSNPNFSQDVSFNIGKEFSGKDITDDEFLAYKTPRFDVQGDLNGDALPETINEGTLSVPQAGQSDTVNIWLGANVSASIVSLSDGKNGLVVLYRDKVVLYTLNGINLVPQWTYQIPSSYPGIPQALAVGNIDNDPQGLNEIVIISVDVSNSVTNYSVITLDTQGKEVWNYSGQKSGQNSGDNGVILANLIGDAGLETIVWIQNDVFIFSTSGKFLTTFKNVVNEFEPMVAADINGDGKNEVICLTITGQLLVNQLVENNNVITLQQKVIPLSDASTSFHASLIVGDVVGGDRAEIIVGPDAGVGGLLILDSEGKVLLRDQQIEDNLSFYWGSLMLVPDNAGKTNLIAFHKTGIRVYSFTKDYNPAAMPWPKWRHDLARTGCFKDIKLPQWIQKPEDKSFFVGEANSLVMTAKNGNGANSDLTFTFTDLPSDIVKTETVNADGKTVTLTWNNPGADKAGTYPVTVEAKDELGLKIKTKIMITVLNLPFIRGDADMSGRVDIGDAIYILEYLYDQSKLIEPPQRSAALDVNDSGTIDISDPIYLLSYLFLGTQPPPPAPFPSAGADPTPNSF